MQPMPSFMPAAAASRSHVAWWLLSAALLGWVTCTAISKTRRRSTRSAAARGDDARLARFGAYLGNGRVLAEQVLKHAGAMPLRAAAARWQAALQPGGAWQALAGAADEDDSSAQTLEAQAGADSASFDRRAALRMHDWIQGARACCGALSLSPSADVRQRALHALAVVEASADDLDRYVLVPNSSVDVASETTACVR